MNCRSGWLALVLLLSLEATASGADPVPGVVAREVLASDSLRAHTFSLMARGQVTEAIDYLTTERGDRLGYIMFKLANGQDVNLSRTGCHVVVRMQGRAYDAYTGAVGMPWAEYWIRLGALSPIAEKVTDTVTRVP